jgi:ELWxxDGT repeat protein
VGGTATLGIDYTGIPATPETKTVSFAAGSDTAIVTVDPTADVGIEADETVTLSIATGSGYTISTITAVVGMILNDDPFINPPGLRRLEIWPGNSSGNPSGFMPAADRLYFSGNDGSHGEELWWSDGSTTFRTGVKSYNNTLPRLASSLYANIANYDPAVLGNSLFFSAYSASNGWALWRYDGTAASLIKDFLPNGYDHSDFSTSWSPYDLTTVGEKLFFSAPILGQVDGNGDGVFEQEFLDPYLWYSDGTAAGTLPLAYLPSGTREKYVVGNLLYFTAFNAAGDFLLWRSDGTPSGTIPLKAFPPYGPLTWAQAGNRLFYEGIESITDPRGAELWTSDGSAAGTVLVKDIAPGPDGSQFAGRSRVNWAAIGNTLYFTADDGSSGMELWKSDGSAAGTVRVADINPGYGGSNPSWLQAVGNTLFFSAASPGDLSSFGNRLWKSDGTTAGTMPLADASSWGPPLNPEWLTAVGNTLYFTATNTPDGTTPWLGRELWKSDGTAAGTLPVVDINPGGGSSWIEWPTLVSDTLFFRATDANYDTELWALDVSADLPAYTHLESQGNTQLLRRSDGLAFVKSGSRTRQKITSPWNSTAGSDNSEWQMLAAETIGGINKILWRNNTSNYLHSWSLDANWNLQSASGSDAFNSPSASELETIFQVDATRDGMIGSPYTTIEAQGNTKLLKRGDGRAFVEVGGARQEITSPWNSTAGSDSSEWQMLAAETIGGISKILWRNNTSNFLHSWSLDANWNLQSASGADGFNTAKAWELETSFQVDATRDGIIGTPFTAI